MENSKQFLLSDKESYCLHLMKNLDDEKLGSPNIQAVFLQMKHWLDLATGP